MSYTTKQHLYRITGDMDGSIIKGSEKGIMLRWTKIYTSLGINVNLSRGANTSPFLSLPGTLISSKLYNKDKAKDRRV